MASLLSRLGFPDTRRSINRVPSPVLALSVPFLSIMLGSMTPTWPLIASAPIMPPLGLLMLLAWRQVRPGVLPIWSGLPLGMVDDLFSGNPFGSAMLLWSIILIVIELVEMRLPWRNFMLEWGLAALAICAFVFLCALFCTGQTGQLSMIMLLPQVALSILIYPLAGRFIAWLDRIRLTPIRDLD